MKITLRMFDVRSKEEIQVISVEKDVLDYIVASNYFTVNESKYEKIEFVPAAFGASTLVVQNVPNLYK